LSNPVADKNEKAALQNCKAAGIFQRFVGRGRNIFLRRPRSRVELLEVLVDKGIVLGRGLERGFSERPPVLQRNRLARPVQLEHPVVIEGAHDHDHLLVILARGPDHARPADVDLLHRFLRLHTRFHDRLLERVEVHHDEFNPPVAELRERCLVLRSPQGDDAGEELGVDGLDPPVQALRMAGVVGDLGLTGIPLSHSFVAVPPVDRISQPGISRSPRTRSTMPVLFHTLIRARRFSSMAVSFSGRAGAKCTNAKNLP
jgi:hypothetical protein